MKYELYHHGILGQRWGIRRFQKKDGSLTCAGRKRYAVDIETAKERVKSAKKIKSIKSSRKSAKENLAWERKAFQRIRQALSFYGNYAS